MAPSKLAKKSTTTTGCIKSVEQQQQKMKKKTIKKKFNIVELSALTADGHFPTKTVRIGF